MRACIVTTGVPTDFDTFITDVKSMATKYNVDIQGYVVVPGVGYAYHGILLEGENTTKFLGYLRMALMPARWFIVSNDELAVSMGQFEVIK